MLFGGELRRCNACRARFVQWGKRVIYPDKARQTLLQTRQWVMVMVGAIVAVAFLIWMASRDAGNPPAGE